MMYLQKLCLFVAILMAVVPNGTWCRQWEMVRGEDGAAHLTHMPYKRESSEPHLETRWAERVKAGPDTKPANKPENSESDFPAVLIMTNNHKKSEEKKTDYVIPSEAAKAYKESLNSKQLGITHMEQVEESKYVSFVSKSADDVLKSAKIDDVKETSIADKKKAELEDSSEENISEEDSGEADTSNESNSNEDPKEVTETTVDEIIQTTEDNEYKHEHEEPTENHTEYEEPSEDHSEHVEPSEDYSEHEEPSEDHTENEEPSEDHIENEEPSEDHIENEEPSENHTESSKDESAQNISEKKESLDELFKRLKEDDLHMIKSHSKRSVKEQLLENDEDLGSGEIPPFEGKSSKGESDDLNPGGAPAIPEDDDVSDEATDPGVKQIKKPSRVVQN